MISDGSERGVNLRYSVLMAIVTFGLEDLAKLGVGRKDAENMTERLGMTLESINESEITIDVTTNRPDMLDIVGFARAAKQLMGKSVPKENFYSISSEPSLTVNVTKAVKRVRPFIAAAVVKSVSLDDNKLKNLINFTEKFCETYGRKRKKIAIGLHNLDSIVGQLTYDAERNGELVPLGYTINTKFADVLKKNDKGVLYSGTLGKSKACPFLKDEKKVIALIPIINCEATRVTEKTTNLFIDVTGTSADAVEGALALISCSFMDGGAQVVPCKIKYSGKTMTTPNLEYRKVKVRTTRAEKTLGVSLNENTIITMSNRLGHVAAKYGNYILTYSPPYRLDVLNEQDIIEDIAIAYGYDRITPLPVVSSSYGVPNPKTEENERVSRLMLGLGFTEAMNTYLTNERLNFVNMRRHGIENTTIKVAYAKTESITMLRTTILPGLLENLSNSKDEKMPQKLFEIGCVFGMDGSRASEKTNVSIVSEHSRANYSEIKSAVEEILRFIGCKDYKLHKLNDGAFIEGRAASAVSESKVLCNFGEVHPAVLANFNIEEPVVAAEIMLDNCIENSAMKKETI